jgi:hypothetical protein
MFHEDIGVDRMGIGVQKRGDAIHYSIPILIVAGEKPAREPPHSLPQ